MSPNVCTGRIVTGIILEFRDASPAKYCLKLPCCVSPHYKILLGRSLGRG